MKKNIILYKKNFSDCIIHTEYSISFSKSINVQRLIILPLQHVNHCGGSFQ